MSIYSLYENLIFLFECYIMYEEVFYPDLTRTLSNNGISYTVHNIRNNKEEMILWIKTNLN